MKRIKKDGIIVEVAKKQEQTLKHLGGADWVNLRVRDKREADRRGITIEELQKSREDHKRKLRRDEFFKKCIRVGLFPFVIIYTAIIFPINLLKRKSLYYYHLAFCYLNLFISLTFLNSTFGYYLYIEEFYKKCSLMIATMTFSIFYLTVFIKKRMKFEKDMMGLIVQNFKNDINMRN